MTQLSSVPVMLRSRLCRRRVETCSNGRSAAVLVVPCLEVIEARENLGQPNVDIGTKGKRSCPTAIGGPASKRAKGATGIAYNNSTTSRKLHQTYDRHMSPRNAIHLQRGLWESPNQVGIGLHKHMSPRNAIYIFRGGYGNHPIRSGLCYISNKSSEALDISAVGVDLADAAVEHFHEHGVPVPEAIDLRNKTF